MAYNDYMYNNMPKMQRLQQMEQQMQNGAMYSNNPNGFQIPIQNNFQQPMNNFMQQQNMNVQNLPIVYECKPVTSEEEAKAAPIRFDGSPIFMEYQVGKKIYKKQLDMNTGGASLETFIKVEGNLIDENIKNSDIDLSSVASKEDFQILKNDITTLLTAQENRIKSIVGGVNNVQSNANDTSKYDSKKSTNGASNQSNTK